MAVQRSERQARPAKFKNRYKIMTLMKKIKLYNSKIRYMSREKLQKKIRKHNRKLTALKKRVLDMTISAVTTRDEQHRINKAAPHKAAPRAMMP
jgi:hypothetical protein